MITVKSAKKTIKAMKSSAAKQMDHMSNNERIAGATAIGVMVGAAATAIGSSLLLVRASARNKKTAKKAAA